MIHSAIQCLKSGVPMHTMQSLASERESISAHPHVSLVRAYFDI